jgi:hypothetical protein
MPPKAAWTSLRGLMFVATLVAACGVVQPETPPPRLVSIATLLEPGGVTITMMDPARLVGLPVTREQAAATARAVHARRGHGEVELPVGSIEVYPATVTIVPRPRRGITGGSHVAWLVALVNADDQNVAELVIVDAATGAVVPYEAAPLAVDALPQH